MVKQGDRFPITFTVNHDLTGAEVRLIVRHGTNGVLEELAHTVSGNTVTHHLDGTWKVGRHYIELRIMQDGEARTAPTNGTYVLSVVQSHDSLT